MTISQMAAPTPSATAVPPGSDQGEIVANPSADPNTRSASDTATAMSAPAKTADQVTADTGDSSPAATLDVRTIASVAMSLS